MRRLLIVLVGVAWSILPAPIKAAGPTQTIITVGSTFGGNNGRHSLLTGRSGTSSQEVAAPMPTAGVIRNWRFRQLTPPSGSSSWTWKIQKNGVDTSLAITINASASEGFDADSVSFAAGDTIRITSTRGGSPLPPASEWQSSIEFVPDVNGTSIYGFGGGGANTYESAIYGTLFDANGGNQFSIVAAAGTMTAMRVNVNGSPGTGKSRMFTLVKNGVVQDGTGGTPDTRLTIADLATAGVASFAMSVSPNDRLQVIHTPVNTPGGGTFVAGSLAFAAATAGEWMLSTSNVVGQNSTAATYHWVVGDQQNGSGTETPRESIGGSSPFVIKTMRTRISAAPVGGQNWTFRLRKNQLDTPLSVTIAAGDSEAVVTGSVTITPGDTFSITAFAEGSPSSITARAWIAFLADSSGVFPPPAITSVTPVIGIPGQAITIVGTMFGETQGASTVTINGVLATVTSWSDTQIGILMPGGATNGPVAVTVHGQTVSGPNLTVSSPGNSAIQYVYDETGRLIGVIDQNGEAARYHYDAVGNLTAISRSGPSQTSILDFGPKEGPIGTSVTIYGTGFSSVPANNTVQFNGTVAAVTFASPTQLIVTVPHGASSGPISVSTPSGQAASGVNFVVTSDLDAMTSFDGVNP